MAMSYTFGGRFAALAKRLEDPDYSLLMARWEAIMLEDNMRGVLEGTDKDGQPMVPVKYRTGSAAPLKKRNRYLKGVGLPLASSGDSLTTAEYRKLGGPPLAPRGKDSRAIRNYVTRSGRQGDDWYAEGAWLNIVSRRGVPFIGFHFNGSGRLPRRDLRGIRPWGRQQIEAATQKTIKQMLAGQ